MKEKGLQKGISFILTLALVLSMGLFTMAFAAEDDETAGAGSSDAVATEGAITTTDGAVDTEGTVTDGAVTTTPDAVTTTDTAIDTTDSAIDTTDGAITTPDAVTTPQGFVFDAAKGVSQFEDAKDNPMASFIDVLIKKDIIRGYEDGTYRPDNNITTAELLSLLMKAAGETTVVSGDTAAPWEEQVMQKAYDLGIVTVEEMAKSEGAKDVNRGNMSMLLVRVSEVMLEEEKVTVENPADYIRDYDAIDEGLKEYVAQAYMKGFVKGDLSANFNATDNATRAEAAVIVSRVIDNTLRTTPTAIEK